MIKITAVDRKANPAYILQGLRTSAKTLRKPIPDAARDTLKISPRTKKLKDFGAPGSDEVPTGEAADKEFATTRKWMAAGAITGGIVGSFVPVVGTVIGAVGGAAAGAVARAFYSIGKGVAEIFKGD